jgi:uncharacterized protein (DUF58 family)
MLDASQTTVVGRSFLRRFVDIFRGEVGEIWLRFFAAVAGLLVAFAAAMFSTVARELGSFWGTLVLSSLALLLAVVVGVTTVPMLARRVAGARLRDAFDYEVTRVGIFYVVAVLVVGIAALNTGNNLLYIVVASMLAAILISGFASAMVLRALELDVRLPEHVFVGQPSPARILVKNPRRWLPSFSIGVVSSKKKKTGKFSFTRSDEHAQSDIIRGSVYFPFIPSGRELSAELHLQFAYRGSYRQESLGLCTRFPFAFLVKTRRIAFQRQVVVYPQVESADQSFDLLPIVNGEMEAHLHGRGDDLYRIREYLPEDSARHVDWKATAKSGALKVREFSREDERRVQIVFDNPGPGQISSEAYERAIRAAASLGWYYAHQNAQVSFAASAYLGSNDIYDFLHYLALAQPASRLSDMDNLQSSSAYNIVITARSRGSIPTALWNRSYFVFIA